MNHNTTLPHSLKTTIVQIPTDADIEFLKNVLIETNQKFVGAHLRKPLAIFVEDENGTRIGGISGQTYGKWLSIDYLWVAEQARGLKLGSHLLVSMEKAAKERECSYAQLDTFSFQARPFYEKHGYQLQMTLQNYPEIHERYYLTKQL